VKYKSRLGMINFKATKKMLQRWTSQIIDFNKLIHGFLKLLRYINDWKKYIQLNAAEPIRLINTYPRVHDKTKETHFDKHYFYQNIWAFKKIYESECDSHIDVGSKIDFIGFLTTITKVTFIDIRPLILNLDNLGSKKGNILALPYKDGSVKSLSCLHVAEHIGLGRYGDSLDPLGTQKAAKELSRVLAPNGTLYFSVPIGKPKLCFNAHRIHSTNQILNYFSDLDLIELSGVDDNGNFIRNINKDILDSCVYGCGFFIFSKIK